MVTKIKHTLSLISWALTKHCRDLSAAQKTSAWIKLQEISHKIFSSEASLQIKSHMGKQGLFPALALGQHSHLHTPSSTMSQTPKAKLPPATSLHWVRGTWLTVVKVILEVGFQTWLCLLLCFYLLKRLLFTHALEKLSPSVWFSLWLHHHLTCCNTLPVNLYSTVGLPLSASLLSIYLWCPRNIGQNHPICWDLTFLSVLPCVSFTISLTMWQGSKTLGAEIGG